jgi:nicotinamide riboside kinase
MPIRDCAVVAVEGTHASGKTTLIHALTSYYRERGVHANCTGEPARSSPFMEEIVLHGKGEFDLVAELDAFAQQFTDQLRAARHYDLLITDKTPLNVVAYARLLLPDRERTAVEAMLQLCTATTTLYDAVLYTSDRYSPHQPGDPWRAKVADQQAQVDRMLRELAGQAGVTLIDVPRGLTTVKRVSWASAYLADLGLPRR